MLWAHIGFLKVHLKPRKDQLDSLTHMHTADFDSIAGREVPPSGESGMCKN